VYFFSYFLLFSYFFALSYEKIPSFRNFFNVVLFNNDKDFALTFFEFFWGNMKKAAEAEIRAVAPVCAAIIYADAKREREIES
jgi:hypothetical protein